MLTFGTFVLWLHVAAVAVWVGGWFAVSFLFVPALRGGVDSPSEAARLAAMVRRRLFRFSVELVVLVVLTGVFNIIVVGVARGFHFSRTYLGLLVAKAVLLAGIVAIQAWQTFRLSPAPAGTAGSGGRGASAPAAADRPARPALATSIVMVILAACAILLGLELRYR